MPITSQQNNTDELERDDYAQRVDKHDEELTDIKGRLEALEERFGSNEKIADTMCEASEKATRLDEMIAKRFLNALQHNVKIKEEVRNIIDRIDRDYFMATIKRIGVLVATIVWSIIMLVIGAFVGALF